MGHAEPSLRRHPRVDTYQTLVSAHGAGRVADALLAKWMADPDAAKQWERLAARVFSPARLREHRDHRGHRLPHRSIGERIVVRLLVNGDTDAQIAARMGISAGEVTTYVRAIRKRLGLVGQSRAALAVACIRRGLVP